MHPPIRRIALLGLLWSAACATSADVASREAESIEVSEQALGESQSQAPVLVLDSGHYSQYVYRGATRESFWIDLSVRNDAPQKEVGVLWTSDGWQTSHTAQASFELGLSAGRERWGVDVRDFATIWGGQTVEVEYAAFAKMNGQTYWSAFRNHYIYQSVMPGAPVRLLSSRVQSVQRVQPDGASVPVLSGAVRALNVASERKVFVRYTVDAWQSFAEREATYDGKDFEFSIELPFDAQASEQTEVVELAVRLEAEGETHWDNNGGQNYQHRLAPSFVSLSFQDEGTEPASGLRVLTVQAQTDLLIDRAWLRFDDGPRLPLEKLPADSYEPVNGFSPSGSIRYVFPVAALTEGPHSVVVEVGAGPFVRSSAALGFVVDNSIAALSTWNLSAGETPWDLEVTADQRAYVMRESQIDIYPSFGTLVPERVLTAPGSERLLDLSVDDSERVYALNNGSAVYRWLATGELDTSFADAGTLDLDGSYAGRALCYAANVETLRNYVYITDSCNSRVLRFSFDGVFEAEIDLSVVDLYTNVSRTFDDGERLWVGVDGFVDGELSHQLVAISDALDQAPAVVDRIVLDPRVQNLDAFALVPGGGVWATTGWQELYRLDAGGVVQALWTGGGRILTQPGAISIARSVTVLSDGSVAVLSVDTARVERFGLAE